MLIPELGVSYEISLPLVRLPEDRFRIVAIEVRFVLGTHTRFTSMEGDRLLVISDNDEELKRKLSALDITKVLKLR